MKKTFDSLVAAIKDLFGNDITIAKRSRISGGDINDAFCLILSDGSSVFMKSNPSKSISFFDAEKEGLNAIASTKTIKTPCVLALGTDGIGNTSFLLLEYIDRGIYDSDYWETLAFGLAAMHKAKTDGFVENGIYGFFRDNFIGERPQKNTCHISWIEFFRDCRLVPQIKSASHYFNKNDLLMADRLLSHLDDFLIEPDSPSLLHGDLWGGNVMAGAGGKAYLIDPAVYVGCREADIAMTELFGSFPRIFYEI